MAIKMSKLKQEKIRRTVYVTVNGEQEAINVFNKAFSSPLVASE